jgi:hypothetical protein
MVTRDGSDPAFKFHPMDSPAAAPIGIHLGISKNVKLPPICAFFSCLKQGFPSFGRGFDSHRPLHRVSKQTTYTALGNNSAFGNN